MRYSVKEACQALQVSDRTLRRAIKTGDLPAQCEPWGGGDRLTLDPGDLAAWAQAAGRPMIPLDNVTKALPAGNTGGEEADRWRDYMIGAALRFQRFRGTFGKPSTASIPAVLLAHVQRFHAPQ